MRPPLVLLPGIQGRVEYVQPAIDALSSDFEVIGLPLCGEPGGGDCDAAGDLDAYARQVGRALDRRGFDRAAICGISFGGLVALRFATREPQRTTALVLASVPGPGWHLRARHQVYARHPRLFGPLFLAESPFRLRPEIVAALPSRRDRLRFVAWQLGALVRAPLSLRRMAARAVLIAGNDSAADAARVLAPTLVITGEPRLDRIVSADATREYLRLIRRVEGTVMARTGHQGSITRPHEFARIVRDFVRRQGEGIRATA